MNRDLLVNETLLLEILRTLQSIDRKLDARLPPMQSITARRIPRVFFSPMQR